MILIIATITAKLGTEREFEDIYRQRIQYCAKEPGTVLWQCAKVPDVPRQYRVIEAYKDEDALKAHVEDAYFKEMSAKARALMEGTPIVERLNGLA